MANYNKSKKHRFGKKFSAAERKAYWMGVGAGEMIRENSDKVLHLPTWKVQDLGSKALESYHKGRVKNYREFK